MNDWRDVVYAHLQAYREDVHNRHICGISGAEAQFLNEHATISVKDGHNIAARNRCDALGQPPPKDAYETIEESAHRVMAQVRPLGRTSCDGLRIPYLITRFLLIKDQAAWKIAGIYQPCVRCNRRAIGYDAAHNELGKCVFCQGSGTDLIRKVQTRGFWIFKRRFFKTGPCSHCAGTGNCPKCAEEEMPGWRRAFSLI
jgi:hypothetical protein